MTSILQNSTAAPAMPALVMVGIGYYGTRLKMTFGYACLRRGERSLTSRCDLFLCSFRGWAFRTRWDGTRQRRGMRRPSMRPFRVPRLEFTCYELWA